MTKHIKEYVELYVDKWTFELDVKYGIKFVTPRSELIEQLCNFDGIISQYPTQFRRGDHIHPTLVTINSVLQGNTSILTDEEREERQLAFYNQYHQRGVDTNGNKETARFMALLELFPEITKHFKIKETVRGSLVDIILISKTDPQVSFGLQIATAIQRDNGQFNFNKIVNDLIKCLGANLAVLLIGMVGTDDGGEEIAGVYMIPPTQDVKIELTSFTGKTYVMPSMLNEKTTSSLLNAYLEQFRYIHEDFQANVVPKFIDLVDNFATDFLTMFRENHDFMANIPIHWSSLFNGNSDRTEWAGNTAYDIHVVNQVNAADAEDASPTMTQTIIHGMRGDMCLEFADFWVKDERKTLGVKHGVKSQSWRVETRHAGRQGIDPSKVHIITASVRSDRSTKTPSEPSDFTACIVLPTTTASGNLAIFPNDPTSSYHLHMTCDVDNHDEYIQVMPGNIALDAYPESMREIINPGTSKERIRIRAVFYYDQLKHGSERLNQLLELYRLFANRTPNQGAIDASITSLEVIESEKQKMKKKKTTTTTTTTTN